MASILDLLKAKGVDTSKLTSDVPSKDDELADILASAQSQQPAPQPTGTPSPLDNAPSPQLPPDQDSTAPANTDKAPAPTDLPDTIFGGFPESYDVDNKEVLPDDKEDEDQDGSPSKGGSSSRSPATDQKSALQNILNQGGFTNNTVAGLQAAQDQARKDKGLDAIMSAVGNISGGLIGLGGHTKNPDQTQNQKFYENQDQQADQGVKDFVARGEQEKNDPDSAISQQARSFAAPLLKKLGMNMPENVSYSALEKLNPLITKMSDAQDASKARSDDLRYKYDSLAAMKKIAGDKKSSDTQDKALLSTQQLLESARGNPAAAQAEKDLYAAQKADSLYNRYKDPNKMNSAEVQLYATEIAKMASGGVPSIHELQGLDPTTVPKDLSMVAQKYTNSPTAANAGDFLKRYKAYSDSLAQDAKQVIQDKYGRVIESRKNQLGDNNYNSLVQNYINRFGTSAGNNAAKGVSSAQSSGKVTVSNGKETYQIDPSDLPHAQADGFQVVK